MPTVDVESQNNFFSLGPEDPVFLHRAGITAHTLMPDAMPGLHTGLRNQTQALMLTWQ